MTTSQEVEDWRVKIKKKIWSEFAAEPNEAHGKFLMKKFDELCDTALFGISINSQTTEGTDARQCPSCNNTFQQPFKCVTCGAQKLYDATLLAAQQRAEKAEAEVKTLRKSGIGLIGILEEILYVVSIDKSCNARVRAIAATLEQQIKAVREGK